MILAAGTGDPSEGACAGACATTVPGSERMRMTLWLAVEAKSASGGSILKGSTVMVSCERSWSAVERTWRLKSARMRWTVREPMATAKAHRMTNVSTAETPARRRRIGSRSKLPDRRVVTRPSAARPLRAKDVAGSPDRVQQARLPLGLQLAAKGGDEHLDRVRGGEGVIAPHLVQQALARDDDALVAHQVLEQLELTLGEIDRPLAADHFVGVDVQRQVADPQGSRAARRAAAQEGAQACEQLLALERLDEIVIRARVEALHPRFEGVTGGEDQDRDVVLGAQRACHLEAVELRRAEVEDHQVGGERAALLQCGLAVGGRAHLVSLHAQRALERLGDVLVVLDHQDPGCASELVHGLLLPATHK